jgi:uncharacterized protein YdhG (YjbR/CyaY superfamily)
MNQYKNVEDYIYSQSPEQIEMLETLRALIFSIIPKAEEVLSYQIPCYKYYGFLVGIGTHKKGCSFYVMNTKLLDTYKSELKNYKYAGTTIHFQIGYKLPIALIKKIIKQRMKENEAKAALRGIK